MEHFKLHLIRQNGVLLQFLEESERDYSICASAIYSNPVAIKFVPVEQYLSLIPQECINDYHIALIHSLYPHAEMFMDDEIILNRRGQDALERVHAILRSC